jgi:hydroxylamine dehydrogenase
MTSIRSLRVGLAVAASLALCLLAAPVSAAPADAPAAPSAATEAKAPPAVKPPTTFKKLSEESDGCVDCHTKRNPGLHREWQASKHSKGNIGCFECHRAEADAPDAYKHYGEMITTIVSPKRCATCHEREVTEFDKSHHATGALILGSLDNTLAEIVEGSFHPGMSLSGESAVAVQGCWQCHGSPVKVLERGKLDPATWPNSGIGRLNPDGSKGSCTACHQRHTFSAAQARQPEVCGKCHLGPDHPQKEIYEESKHGIAYRTNIDTMHLNSTRWVVGVDYTAAPTCATCHMSATRDLPVTHDVGARISWTLRPPISEKIDAAAVRAGKQVKPWTDRRSDMMNVCSACHQTDWVESFYTQFDAVVTTYNEKFAKPGASIMKALTDNGLITKVDFDSKIKWTWYYLWHHEGRRLRHGAAMQGPDYVQWHGFFEVAEKFYTGLIPEAQEITRKAAEDGKTEQAAAVNKVIDDILARPEHVWFLGQTVPGKDEHTQKRLDYMKKFTN